MEEKAVKRRIKGLLLLQQETILSGDIHPHLSAKHIAFLKLRMFLVEEFGLAPHNLTYEAAFDYPFSLSRPHSSHCGTELCSHMMRRVTAQYKSGLTSGKIKMKKNGVPIYSLDAAVDFVYDNLMVLAW